ncbi:MAG: M28 family peptidase, partial [Clostridiales Family XIII bacterium]|nr:M28 family peptidase [Clostridiales Family XIII bacterium]
MRVPLRIFFAACVAVVLVVVVALSGTRQSTSRDLSTKPERSQAPAGYDAFEAASDATFAKAIADQVSALGNDPETGGRTAGSPAEREAAQLLEQTMKDIGLQNVTVDEVSADSWVFKGASLSFIGADGETQHATLGGYQTDLVVNGRSFPVMDLGRGTAADYKGKDVRDKLVLIDVDMENDWWINYPAMQAKQMGAKAVLAVGVMAAPGRDRLVSQDICGPADAPVLSISEGDAARIREALRANGRGKGKARQINATLYADSRVGEGDTTQNVWGEIPGNTDDVILFTAHYDGYYHAFFDDAIGVGLILDMAKSFVESGYVPEKTLRFIVHGAEEWGKADSEADWAIGAWRQVSEARPDWPGKIFALVNLDSAYPLAPMQSFSLSVPYELRNFAGQAVSAFGDRSALRIDADGELPSPYREDFSYNALGVPTFASEGGEGDEEYFASMYHSSMDTSEVGGFSEDAAKGIMRFFGFTTFLLDRTPVRPLTFSPRIEALQATVDAAEEAGLRVDPHLSANIERAGIAATAIDGIVR